MNQAHWSWLEEPHTELKEETILLQNDHLLMKQEYRHHRRSWISVRHEACIWCLTVFQWPAAVAHGFSYEAKEKIEIYEIRFLNSQVAHRFNQLSRESMFADFQQSSTFSNLVTLSGLAAPRVLRLGMVHYRLSMANCKNMAVNRRKICTVCLVSTVLETFPASGCWID